jgi:DUF1009 family protein
MGTSSTTLGLIAGAGSLPREIARAARERGHRVVAVALRGCCDSGLRELADEFHWLEVGELNALFEVFREARVKDAVMAGKVSKQRLFQAAPGAGPLGHLSPTPAQWLDIEFGFEIAKALGEQGIGQSVVVRQRAVLAVEAIEGTDAAIARGAALGGAGVCVVKVAKPRQDPRFDLPAIGPETVSVMQGVGAAVLAFEADATLVLQRPKLVRDADAAGIALVGVSSEGLRDRASGAEDR